MDTLIKTGRFKLPVKGITAAIIFGVVSFGCASQSNYDALVKENVELKNNLKLAQNREADTEKGRQQTKKELDLTSEVLVMTAVKARSQEEAYNKLVNGLSKELVAKQITVSQMKSGVNVNLTEGVLFSSGSANVSAAGRAVLEKVSAELADMPYQTIVAGFTDNAPIGGKLAEKFPTNWDLASARATEVVRILENTGLPGTRLVAVSFGENQPVATNETPDGRKQNRRIEIRLRPVETPE